jgi:hypothetical protein
MTNFENMPPPMSAPQMRKMFEELNRIGIFADV